MLSALKSCGRGGSRTIFVPAPPSPDSANKGWPGNFPTFWDWLAHMGNLGNVKIPREQYEEITTGTGPLVDWLKREDVKRSLLLNEDAVPALVADVTANGYGPLDETGLEKVGKD